MNILSRFLIIAACGLATAQAGDTVVERQEFKQSTVYPYVFRPVCYLATSGPVPLRFAVSPPDCGDRRAPRLPPAAKHNPKPEVPAAPVTPPVIPGVEAEPVATTVPTPPTTAAPAFPPPTNAPVPKPSSVDFAQFPAELVEAFKKGRDSAEARNYLFDPIFQPALPDDLPKSKATYKEK
jgi:hypothetical protein